MTELKPSNLSVGHTLGKLHIGHKQKYIDCQGIPIYIRWSRYKDLFTIEIRTDEYVLLFILSESPPLTTNASVQ